MKGNKEEKKAESSYCTRGWNWGNYEIGEDRLDFKVASMPCISVPYSDIANANIVGKNEVIVEFHEDDTAKDAYFSFLHFE